MFLTNDKNFCDTLIAKKTDLIRNNILDSTYSILSSLYIVGAQE